MPITCEQIKAEGLLEKYLDGKLDRQQRDALEFHTRSCPKCGLELQDMRAMRREAGAASPQLPASKESSRLTGPKWIWIAALLAAIAVALAAAYAWRGTRRGAPGAQPLTSAAPPLPPTGVLRLSRETILQDLARFRPLPFRGPVEGVASKSEPQLHTAMQLYVRRQYAQAAAAFEEVVKANPKHAYSLLYLGVCRLVLGDNARAEELFRQVLESRDPNYQEEARYYRAKALFAQRNVDEGRKELRVLAASASPWTGDVQRMLTLLEQLDRDLP